MTSTKCVRFIPARLLDTPDWGIPGSPMITRIQELISRYWSAQSPLTKGIMAGGALVLIGRLAFGLSEVASISILSRLVQPQEMSAYFLIVSIANASVTIGLLGSNRLVIPMLAEARTEPFSRSVRSVVCSALILGVAGSLAVSAGLYFRLYDWLSRAVFASAEMAELAGAVALLIICLAVSQLIGEIFRGLKDLRFATLFSGPLFSVANFVAFTIAWLLMSDAPLKSIVFILVVNSSIVLALAWTFLHAKLRDFQKTPPRYQNLLIRGLPFLLTGVITLVSANLDIWILGVAAPRESVAIYGAALRLSFLVGLPLIILNGVLPPFIAELHSQNKTAQLERLLRTSSTLAFIPAGALTAVLMVGSGPILELLYGTFYSQADVVLRLLIVAKAFSVFAGSSGLCLLVTGRQNLMLLTVVLSTSYVLALALWLVDWLGAPGVALAVSTGIILQNLLQILLAKKSLGIWTHARPLVSLKTLANLSR